MNLENKKREALLPAPGRLARLPQKVSIPAEILGETEPEPTNFLHLIRTYLKLCIPLALLGALVGLVFGVVSTPLYSARVLLEIQPISQDFLGKGGMDPFAGSYNLDGPNLQTQVLLLESGPFKRRVIQKLLSQPAPPPAISRDVFARLRASLFPKRAQGSQDLERSVLTAANTFTVRIINETRLVELSSESPNPSVASSFLNDIATDFVDDTIQQRNEASEKTRRWLAGRLDDTKDKLQNAEAELRAFVVKSGNVFAGSDGTVDDVKLKQLQNDMAIAETARIGAQSQYESAARNDLNSAPPILSDPTVQSLRKQIQALEEQKTILLTTYKPMHPKVLALEEQERELQSALKQEASIVTGRLQNEYQGALRHERLLVDAYGEESQKVGSLASKASEYASLRRNVESLRAIYDSSLQEMNKTEVAQSAPIIPVRLVEPSSPPESPYKPKPQTDIILGLVMGFAASVGIIFLREKMENGLRTPQSVQNLVRVPQLGVIPAVANTIRPNLTARFSALLTSERNGPAAVLPWAVNVNNSESSAVAKAVWGQRIAPVVDSFRATLGSINRHIGQADCKMLLVSSSIPKEGKTSVVSNLGIALSEAGRRVVIVDADFYRPALSKIFPVRSSVDLGDILRDEKPISSYALSELVAETELPGLHVLPCRAIFGQSPTLIYSPRLPELLDRLREEFELVLLDAPPILYPADARVLGQFADGAILVIRARSTEKQLIRTAVGALHEDGVPIIGTILNDWVPTHQGKHNYYSYYYQQASKS